MPDLDRTPYGRLALVVARFRDCVEETTIAAIAVRTGVARLSYGDLRALVSALSAAEDRLSRIASWHPRETSDGGMVGDYCTECGTRWPCETRRMADGSHEDLKEVTDATG